MEEVKKSLDHQIMLLLLGSVGWLFGLSLIIAGYSEYAWFPISWGGFAFGYRAGKFGY